MKIIFFTFSIVCFFCEPLFCGNIVTVDQMVRKINEAFSLNAPRDPEMQIPEGEVSIELREAFGGVDFANATGEITLYADPGLIEFELLPEQVAAFLRTQSLPIILPTVSRNDTELFLQIKKIKLPRWARALLQDNPLTDHLLMQVPRHLMLVRLKSLKDVFVYSALLLKMLRQVLQKKGLIRIPGIRSDLAAAQFTWQILIRTYFDLYPNIFAAAVQAAVINDRMAKNRQLLSQNHTLLSEDIRHKYIKLLKLEFTILHYLVLLLRPYAQFFPTDMHKLVNDICESDSSSIEEVFIAKARRLERLSDKNIRLRSIMQEQKEAQDSIEQKNQRNERAADKMAVSDIARYVEETEKTENFDTVFDPLFDQSDGAPVGLNTTRLDLDESFDSGGEFVFIKKDRIHEVRETAPHPEFHYSIRSLSVEERDQFERFLGSERVWEDRVFQAMLNPGQREEDNVITHEDLNCLFTKICFMLRTFLDNNEMYEHHEREEFVSRALANLLATERDFPVPGNLSDWLIMYRRGTLVSLGLINRDYLSYQRKE